MRAILGIDNAPHPHWVGDGFPVRSLFAHGHRGADVTPFLLLDYAGPAQFSPAEEPRGVGTHPHRGFETVTIVYQGEVEHRDSTGQGGVIGPGDVQWMTAAGGILHREFHSRAFTRTGGTLEMAQLWVNLPAKHKNAPPGYQTLLAGDIPTVALPDGAGTLRVVAGDYAGARGPAQTFTPIDVWDVQLKDGQVFAPDLPEGRPVVVVIRAGTVAVNGEAVAHAAQTVRLDRKGGGFTLRAQGEAGLLILSGEPIDEPTVMHGPFVMNSADEIREAIADFQSGRFGAIEA